MLIRIGLLGLSMGLAGCASTYKAPSNQPSAELSVTAKINGNEDSITRRLYALALAESSCAKNSNGDSIGYDTKTGSPDSLSFGPTQISTNGRLHLIAGYSEHRFAEDLDCIVDASFQLVPGKKYQGLLHIKNNVRSCEFTIADTASGANIAIETPREACPFAGYTATGEYGPMRLNGVGTDVITKTKVILMH